MGVVEDLISRSRNTAHGFTDLQAAADELVAGCDGQAAKAVALDLLCTDVHQARCIATFILGRLAASDPDALQILKQRISLDPDWRVQEILAKAFDRFCQDTGYEKALPVIREWLSADHPNTRRAVTEGLRIWTGRPYFREHPGVAVALLSAQRSSESDYLRKSVGNALRDISKKHPDLVREEIEGWDLTHSGVAKVARLATRFIASKG
ncbi:HEAT repeat domain-containing protein [Aurantiacibacter xanthus]|uniref:HEAT repeat domain-containing protein n=1 Tax=Aurantiacibacter xanthus TaxID=1784712 RepID=A0A3A1P3H9_9SPHN|nr:DNA alkylation repair protein [Aurantiacibacter xanthus]RIV80898.1 HEAT repeat domain-containing protein [Aurantiacibacter xanthus]